VNDTQKNPILLFDGVCNLCSTYVEWLLSHDTKGVFRFAPLQSALGQNLLKTHGYTDRALGTMVLVADGTLYVRSDAVLELLRRLGGVWSLAYGFKILPRFLRDAVYKAVANNRYRWFGKRESCWLPRREWADRFLDKV